MSGTYLGALLAGLTADVRLEGGSSLKSKYETLRHVLEAHKRKEMSEGANIVYPHKLNFETSQDSYRYF